MLLCRRRRQRLVPDPFKDAAERNNLCELELSHSCRSQLPPTTCFYATRYRPPPLTTIFCLQRAEELTILRRRGRGAWSQRWLYPNPAASADRMRRAWYKITPCAGTEQEVLGCREMRRRTRWR